MLQTILPRGVESEESFGAPPDDDLFPEEVAAFARVTEGRRREHAAVRACARACLGRLGQPPVAILRGPAGAPAWPSGVRGSMTHCAGYAAAAIGPAHLVSGIGIDAEPDDPLPEGVVQVVATPAELGRLADLPSRAGDPSWDRLLFSAKESLYKAWFPLVGEWLDPQEAEIRFRPDSDTFTALVLRAGLVVDGRPVARLSGRWVRRDGLLLTAIVLTTG